MGKLRKHLKNKKGVSLMEILVASLIFAMITVAVTAILTPMVMAFVRANEFAEVNSLLDNVGNAIISDMSLAVDDIEINSDDDISILTRNGIISYTISDDGFLMVESGNLDPRLVFPREFYGNMTISFEVSRYDPGMASYTLVVTVTQSDSITYISREFIIRPLMLMSP